MIYFWSTRMTWRDTWVTILRDNMRAAFWKRALHTLTMISTIFFFINEFWDNFYFRSRTNRRFSNSIVLPIFMDFLLRIFQFNFMLLFSRIRNQFLGWPEKGWGGIWFKIAGSQSYKLSWKTMYSDLHWYYIEPSIIRFMSITIVFCTKSRLLSER